MSALAHGIVSFELEPRGKGTLLKLTHRAFGELTKETERNYTGGWTDLLGTRLKELVERGKRAGLRARG
jgi:hypothetical protein